MDVAAGETVVQSTQHDEPSGPRWADLAQNPRNWSKSRKLCALCLVSFQAFTSPFASSVIAPGLPEISKKYDIKSDSVQALILTVYLLGWAFGPLVFGPLSDMYGRRRILNISGLIFAAFSIGCIFSRSVSELIAFRFLAGIGASTPISIAGAVIADMYELRDRAPANAIYGFGLLIGPPTGPVIGGYLTQTVGVKYCFVLASCLVAVGFCLGLFFLPETHHDAIQEKRRRHPKQMWFLKSSTEPESNISNTDKSASFAKKKIPDIKMLFMPIILLFRSPVCLPISLYGAFVYALLNVFFTIFPTIFGDIYGFSPGTIGLSYIGGGLGELLATVVSGWLGNTMYHKLMKNNDGVHKPEFRIPGMLLGSGAVPVGLVWFGWSATASVHWIMPILGSSVFGFGLMSILLPLQLYTIDAFRHAASALAASALTRSLLAFAIPLFTPQMISVMGLRGTFSLLGGLSVVVGLPLPVWIYYKGESFRAAGNFGN